VTDLPLGDLLRNREVMMKMFLVAFWSSLVFIAIGAYFIVRELFG
jgi:hypothetical protein